MIRIILLERGNASCSQNQFDARKAQRADEAGPVRAYQRPAGAMCADRVARKQGNAEQGHRAELNVGRVQAGRWRERYAESRLAGIERDLPRGALTRKVDVARLAALTTQTPPPQATQWSTHSMADALGVS